MKNLYFFLLAVCLICVSCTETDPRYPRVITPILIAHGELYGNGQEGITKQNLVIRTQEEWDNLLNAMNSVNNVSNSFAETEIDFNSYMVIAVFDEIRGNSGCSINISNIIEYIDKIVVDVHIVTATSGADVMNQPFYIVKIPVIYNNIVFDSNMSNDTVPDDTIPNDNEMTIGYIMDYAACSDFPIQYFDSLIAPLYNIISENLMDTFAFSTHYCPNNIKQFPKDFFINTSAYRYSYKIEFEYEDVPYSEIGFICNTMDIPPIFRHPNARPIKIISANFIN